MIAYTNNHRDVRDRTVEDKLLWVVGKESAVCPCIPGQVKGLESRESKLAPYLPSPKSETVLPDRRQNEE